LSYNISLLPFFLLEPTSTRYVKLLKLYRFYDENIIGFSDIEPCGVVTRRNRRVRESERAFRERIRKKVHFHIIKHLLRQENGFLIVEYNYLPHDIPKELCFRFAFLELHFAFRPDAFTERAE
jgi:hypothetical protein